jgi:alkanesulfonate monooxygenase SsuD/methylene tetrahydromethanopterin reductase-like flavin-dependent oxidoreductase (luciferase family)
MRVGLLLPMSADDAGRVLGFARRAEELGFDGLFAFDHFFPPGAPPDRPSFESYATLAAVAAVTERVTLGTLVTRASLRPVGMLAHQVATLDDVSGGRFVLGIGTGDQLSRREHVAFGLPYLEPGVRRQHLVGTVAALRALFRGEPWHGGELVPAMDGPLVHRGRGASGPPIWIGGTSEGAVRAAASEGDGWNAWGIDPETFARRAELLRASSEGRRVEATWGGVVVVGRDADEAERLVSARRDRGLTDDSFAGDASATVAWLSRFADAGATWVVLLPGGAGDRIEVLGELVLPRLRTGP